MRNPSNYSNRAAGIFAGRSRFLRAAREGPKARLHTSLGQRPRIRDAKKNEG